MLAEKLKDVTRAEGTSEGFARAPRPEKYEPANPGPASSSLIFMGPRMQVRTQVAFGSRRYHLRDVFVVALEYAETGEVFATHRQLPVHGQGMDQAEALASFCETFDFQWRNLVDVPLDSLTPGGQTRRRAMEAVVDRVEEI